MNLLYIGCQEAVDGIDWSVDAILRGIVLRMFIPPIKDEDSKFSLNQSIHSVCEFEFFLL